eukprot:80296_1
MLFITVLYHIHKNMTATKFTTYYFCCCLSTSASPISAGVSGISGNVFASIISNACLGVLNVSSSPPFVIGNTISSSFSFSSSLPILIITGVFFSFGLSYIS